jgi:AraC-like DNA-binding protein
VEAVGSAGTDIGTEADEVATEATTVSEYLVRRPAPQLTPYIEQYVGYRLLGFPPGLHRGLPSRHMTFIVSIGPVIEAVALPDPHQAPARYRCVLGGLQAAAALIAHDGDQEGVAFELTPVGCRTLFGMPARALWSTSVELDEVVGPLGNELWERLQPAATWDERFAVCDAVLSRLVCDEHQALVVPELCRSWQLLVASGGEVTVGDLATHVGWSRQHLARRFRAEFGLSPKLAGRVVRFERARRMLQSTPSYVSIAQVAAACGYYDQAHMTRDFVELADCPPGRLLVEEDLPSFQDADDPLPSR